MSNAGCFAVDTHGHAWWCPSPLNTRHFSRLPLSGVGATAAGDTTAYSLGAATGLLHSSLFNTQRPDSCPPFESWVTWDNTLPKKPPPMAAVASGSSHCCAVSRQDGAVWVQGWGLRGALGLGVSEDSPQPQLLRSLGPHSQLFRTTSPQMMVYRWRANCISGVWLGAHGCVLNHWGRVCVGRQHMGAAGHGG